MGKAGLCRMGTRTPTVEMRTHPGLMLSEVPAELNIQNGRITGLVTVSAVA